MKITAVETVVVNAVMRNWIFVKVVTDQPGLHGWGEATLEWKTRAVTGAVEDLAPFVVGEDPMRIEHLSARMSRFSFWPLGVIGMSALSGIEMALWDIKGKALGVPVWELLGGRVRDRVRVYTHMRRGRHDGMSAPATSRPSATRCRRRSRWATTRSSSASCPTPATTRRCHRSAMSRSSPPRCASGWARGSTS